MIMDVQEQKIKRITAVLLKYISRRNSCTHGNEWEELGQLMPGQEAWLEQVDALQTVREDYEHFLEITSTGEAWDRLEKEISVHKGLPRRLWTVGAVAAVCVIALGAFIFLKFGSGGKVELLPVNVHEQALVALIVGEGGDSLNLRDERKVKSQLGYVSNKNNTLIYDTVNLAGHDTEWHTLKVGKGGEYRLVLSDGTVVWLNAGSSLRYPVRFNGEYRKVELQGEGFFQVAREEEKPFVVKMGKVSVDVLGTVFNVMNYADDPYMLVTLASGKVRVNAGDHKVILNPDEQAQIAEEGISVRKVEARYYISWTENRFLFEEEPLEMIVRRLARWYNLEFEFIDPELKMSCFTGALPKYEDISKAFELLEMTTNVRFIMNQQTITIMRKDK